jgi:hypothetical protein
MANYPNIIITDEMLTFAEDASKYTKVNRTIASPFDTTSGLLGELAFADWFLGDWKLHDVFNTKGKSDFFDEIEIKTSAFPFSDKLNLLVRKDYAEKRKPIFYVQTIINLPNRDIKTINAGMQIILAGYATSEDLDASPLRDFGSKFGGKGGYLCHYIQISKLKNMSLFKEDYSKLKNE